MLYGLVFVLVVALAVGLTSGLVPGLLVGLVGGIALVAIVGFARRIEVDGSSLGPADVWRHDRNAALTAWFVFVLVFVVVSWLVPGLVLVLASGLVVVLLVGFVVGLVVARMVERRGAESWWGSAALDTAPALVQLAIQYKTPLRLIAFLEDARSRHLLRTVGPVYQFRHAKLQDRLAQPNPEDPPAVDQVDERHSHMPPV
jgi:hypothetical protein